MTSRTVGKRKVCSVSRVLKVLLRIKKGVYNLLFLYRASSCVKELKDNNEFICFRSNTTIFYYLT